jgi:hypoxanthine phosphoribosyltransferase
LKFLHITWDDFQRLCKVVANKVVKASYRPEIVVAISRGGFPPARVLCDFLGIKVLASLGIEYYTSVTKTKKRPEIIYPLNIDLRGKKILIVDDIADTGHSMVLARDQVLKGEASRVKMATLHCKPWSVVKPDFYAETADAWVVYPWEVMETIKSLIIKLKNEGNIAQVKKQLLNFGFKEKTLKDLI